VRRLHLVVVVEPAQGELQLAGLAGHVERRLLVHERRVITYRSRQVKLENLRHTGREGLV
jgi:hypothetical protein